MNLLEIIPLIRLPKGSLDTLSYYTSRIIPAGSLVEIAVNKRLAVGVVLTSTPISDVKALVRKQSFSLKKITAVIKEYVVPEYSIKLFLWTAKFFATPRALLFKTALPNYFAKPSKALGVFASGITALPFHILRLAAPAKTPREPLYLEGSYTERIRRYEQEIQKLWVENPRVQILALFPTSTDARAFHSAICRETAPDAILYTSALTDKQNAEAWRHVLSGETRLIIGTRNAVFIPAPNLVAIIVDGENSIHHKSWDSNPKFDARDIAEKIAETLSIQLILGGNFPREETWHRIQAKSILRQELTESIRAAITIIDTRKETKESGTFRVIGRSLEAKLRTAISARERVFLFSGRRGYAAHILCQDCGYLALCAHCSAPIVAHHTSNDPLASRVLICHKCLKRETPPKICPECGGHRLQGFSIGSQRIEEELKTLFPEARILRIDADASDDPKEFSEFFLKIKRGEYEIVIGTEFALKPSAVGSFPLTVIISFNQLLQQPDFRQEERAFGIVTQLLEMTERECVIQTSTPAAPLVREIETLDAETFFKRDSVFRKAFFYPPFAEIIKITTSNKLRLVAEKNSLVIKNIIAEEFTKAGIHRESLFLIGPIPAFIPKEKNEYIYNIILKIKDQHDAVKGVLQNHLPPYAMIDVNPKTIL